jgi:hypothetical protein
MGPSGRERMEGIRKEEEKKDDDERAILSTMRSITFEFWDLGFFLSPFGIILFRQSR